MRFEEVASNDGRWKSIMRVEKLQVSRRKTTRERRKIISKGQIKHNW
jgi:hypothetical protein